MGRNLKKQSKIVRRLKVATTTKQLRILSRRPTPPGQHGPSGHPRISEYGKQLQEKQKAKFIYGIMERQFANYVTKALRAKGDNGLILFTYLERRLDNSVFRAGLATTRPQARQLVSHAHFLVNDKKVDVPSYQIKVGDVITVKPQSQNSPLFAKAKENAKNVESVSWINADIAKLTFKIVDLPKAADMTGEFDTKLIIEFYSK